MIIVLLWNQKTISFWSPWFSFEILFDRFILFLLFLRIDLNTTELQRQNNSVIIKKFSKNTMIWFRIMRDFALMIIWNWTPSKFDFSFLFKQTILGNCRIDFFYLMNLIERDRSFTNQKCEWLTGWFWLSVFFFAAST